MSGGSEEEKSGEPKVTDASPARATSPAPKVKKVEQPTTASKSEGTNTSAIVIAVVIIVAVIGAVCGAYYWWNLPKEGELTKSTWDDATAGKTVFVKFQAPW